MHWHVRDGGVGKTTLAAHIHNQLQEKPHIFFSCLLDYYVTRI